MLEYEVVRFHLLMLATVCLLAGLVSVASTWYGHLKTRLRPGRLTQFGPKTARTAIHPLEAEIGLMPGRTMFRHQPLRDFFELAET